MERQRLEAGLRALAAGDRLMAQYDGHNRRPLKTSMRDLRHRRVRRQMRQRLRQTLAVR